MPLTSYASSLVLKFWYEGDVSVQPFDLYVGLSFNRKVVDGELALRELVSSGYERVRHNDWNIAGSTVSNSEQIEFPTAKADWGHINYFGIFDSPTQGNLLLFDLLTSGIGGTSQIYIAEGETPLFPAGQLVITL